MHKLNLMFNDSISYSDLLLSMPVLCYFVFGKASTSQSL